MKNLSILSLLLISLCFFSCKDECDDVMCFNGGVCDDGICECTGLFDGADCSNECIDLFDGTWNVNLNANGSPFFIGTTTFNEVNDAEVNPVNSEINWMLIRMEDCNSITASVPNPNPGVVVNSATGTISSDTQIIINLDATISGQAALYNYTFTK